MSHEEQERYAAAIGRTPAELDEEAEVDAWYDAQAASDLLDEIVAEDCERRHALVAA